MELKLVKCYVPVSHERWFEEGVYPLNSGKTVWLKEQSLYCFTKEELQDVIAEAVKDEIHLKNSKPYCFTAEELKKIAFDAFTAGQLTFIEPNSKNRDEYINSLNIQP